MLQADKDLVEARAAVSVLSIREKELALYTRNTNLLGTVSAIMAGIGYFGLVYVKMGYYKVSGPASQFVYVNSLTVSMCLAMQNLLGTTTIAVLGPGLALRGGPGSMHKAIDLMLGELETVTNVLHKSIYCFMVTLIAYAWGGASPHWICSLALTFLALATAALISWSTNKVESTFPIRTMKLTSGAFFTSIMKRRRQVQAAQAAEDAAGAATPSVVSLSGDTTTATPSARTVESLPSLPSGKLIPYHSERIKAYIDGEESCEGDSTQRRKTRQTRELL